MIRNLLILILCGCGMAVMADNATYQELDRNIVKAYNSAPRNTGAVYANSMRILEKARQEGSTEAGPWELKARKLITVSCFYECTQAIDKKLYRDAYVWAKRGEKCGTVIGKVGSTPVKNLYDYLAFAGRELQTTPMVKNSSTDELQTLINATPDLAALMVNGWLLRQLALETWSCHG